MAQKRDYIIMRESYARFFHRARHSARTTAWLALRESVEEVMQTIENDGLLAKDGT